MKTENGVFAEQISGTLDMAKAFQMTRSSMVMLFLSILNYKYRSFICLLSVTTDSIMCILVFCFRFFYTLICWSTGVGKVESGDLTGDGIFKGLHGKICLCPPGVPQSVVNR